jgi:protein disulfide-isomerase
MKSLLLAFILTMIAQESSLRASEWTTDYPAALDKARSQNKLVLLNFTGSDWCPYCKLLDQEVFAQPAFKAYAGKLFVLVTVDFPDGKTLPEPLQMQNDSLRQMFQVDGFPTLIVLNAKSKKMARQTGYDPGSGAQAEIAELQKLVDQVCANVPRNLKMCP